MTLFQNSKGNLWVGANDEGIVCIKKDGSILSFDKMTDFRSTQFAPSQKTKPESD